ncbi:hypothetical protein EIP91_002942 [Steccherinum ochraceum]|uniref:Calcineurin-like phosphoesterase domain-containing protein n=1 Tax=Steccherinum ochraceum TaxID=92696 RepID=A0A4R0RRZ6_9APHY|nr:hypothetical protein EIP91_002942 [Steccherinum ochraceum]
MVRRNSSGASPWSGVSYAIVVLFVALFFLLGVTYRRPHFDFGWKGRKKYDFPDFDSIRLSRALPDEHVSLDTNDRIIIIGDVHGMNHSLADLLNELSYNQSDDILMFAGDLIAKSTHAGSLSVLDFLTENQYSKSANTTANSERIFAVRGNHDQLVMQWRSWREWFEPLVIPASTNKGKDAADAVSTGKAFVDLIEAEWSVQRRKRDSDAEEWVDVARKRAEGTWREEWWRRIPPPGNGKKAKDWKLFGDHYWLARDMTDVHAAYLKSLPLVHHVPSMHFFVVHAGLLPYNPRLPIDHPSQPLAHPPKISGTSPTMPVPSTEPSSPTEPTTPTEPIPPAPPTPPAAFDSNHEDDDDDDDDDDELGIEESDIDSLPPQTILDRRAPSSSDDLRQHQESAILTSIPQNKDPWVLLNMRGVKKNGKVTRNTDEGTPWAKLWNRQMKGCRGINIPSGLQDDEEGGEEFPCEPSTVVYGHAASRGLDVKRYSVGLDTGCLYGQKLTALVVRSGKSSNTHSGDDDDNDDDKEEEDHENTRRTSKKRKMLGRRQHGGKGKHRGKRVKFGDDAMGLDARLVQVKCALPPEEDSHDH